MDISAIGKAQDTIDVELYHPVTGEPILNEDKSVMTVTVHGPYSKVYKKANHDLLNRRLARANRSGGKITATAEELESQGFDILVKIVAGWNITLDGEKPKATESKIREVFTDYPWLREQVDAGVSDTKAFLKA